MSATVWIRHGDTGAVVEVPAEALPMYRQSGWDTVPKKDLADRDAAAADEAAAAEAAMQEQARLALGQEPTPPVSEPSAPPHSDEPSSDAAGRQSKKGIS